MNRGLALMSAHPTQGPRETKDLPNAGSTVFIEDRQDRPAAFYAASKVRHITGRYSVRRQAPDMTLTFLLNGECVDAGGLPPTTTLLDWLREVRGLTGTKEGCNEGDCGACTVIVSDETGARPLNACILLLPQLHGKAVRTVEGISGPDGALHPVQQAMIEHHGSQCGFCTPGFIASMACAHFNGETDHDRMLAGNLCRCTGYAPILRAARAAEDAPVPDWMRDDPGFFLAEILSGGPEGRGADSPPLAWQPRTTDELARLFAAHPQATLIAGATDVGLWVTKQLRDLERPIFLNGCADLQAVEIRRYRDPPRCRFDHRPADGGDRTHHPSYAAMLRRYGSEQVRAAATLGAISPMARPSATTRPR